MRPKFYYGALLQIVKASWAPTKENILKYRVSGIEDMNHCKEWEQPSVY